MTKKKKIIISSCIVGVILLGVILTLILVNIKRFDMHATDKFDYNNHTTLNVIERDTTYIYEDSGTLYKGGTEIIENRTTNKYGLYSYIQNKNVVEPIYDSIVHIEGNTTTTKDYFRCNLASASNNEIIIDENGENVSFLTYDESTQTTLSEIKTRTIDLSQSKNSVKSKITKKYHNESIKVNRASLITGNTYNCCYTDGETYTYEVWELQTTDNLTYINLYEIIDGKHVLVQTLNNQLGVSLESQNLELMFLTDGTPILLNTKQIAYNSQLQAIEYEIYDINFNLKGSSQINTNVIYNLVPGCSTIHLQGNALQKIEFTRVGDSLIFQTKMEATEDKYDYFEVDTLGTKYYTLNTFKLNLKNCDITEVSFDYYIEDATTAFNTKTILLAVRKIRNKQLSAYENLLINERFQTKTIDYSFSAITQITNNRFITYSLDSEGNKYNFNLIDKNYNIITHLEDFQDIYATSNAIIVTDNTTAYICNLDGIVVKKISKSEFTYLFDEHYYLISKNVKSESGTYTEYYLEELGLTKENALYSKNSSEYYINGTSVDYVKRINEEFATLILSATANGDGTYNYSVYNVNGTLLATITGMEDKNLDYDCLYSDDNNVVLKLGTKYLVLDR